MMILSPVSFLACVAYLPQKAVPALASVQMPLLKMYLSVGMCSQQPSGPKAPDALSSPGR